MSPASPIHLHLWCAFLITVKSDQKAHRYAVISCSASPLHHQRKYFSCDYFVKCRRHYFIFRFRNFAIFIFVLSWRDKWKVFLLRFSPLGGVVWVIRNPMKCALHDLTPQQLRRIEEGRLRARVWHSIWYSRLGRGGIQNKTKNTLWLIYAAIRRRRKASNVPLDMPGTDPPVYTCRRWPGADDGPHSFIFLFWVRGLEVLFLLLFSCQSDFILSKVSKAHGTERIESKRGWNKKRRKNKRLHTKRALLDSFLSTHAERVTARLQFNLMAKFKSEVLAHLSASCRPRRDIDLSTDGRLVSPLFSSSSRLSAQRWTLNRDKNALTRLFGYFIFINFFRPWS